MKLHYMETNGNNYQREAIPEQLIDGIMKMKTGEIFYYHNDRFRVKKPGYLICIDNIENEDEWIHWIK